jgi:hypothetical protein
LDRDADTQMERQTDRSKHHKHNLAVCVCVCIYVCVCVKNVYNILMHLIRFTFLKLKSCIQMQIRYKTPKFSDAHYIIKKLDPPDKDIFGIHPKLFQP